jgi:DNA-binding winged helix-turn-helix (wHTH) protein
VNAASPSSGILRFDIFEVDFRNCQLRRGGIRVELQPQAFAVLKLLASRPGELFTREEISKTIWPEDQYGDVDSRLNFEIRQIRRAMGDDAERPRYIETVRKTGYRFIAPVLPPATAEGSGSTPPLTAPRWSRPGHSWAITIALLAAVAAGLTSYWLWRTNRANSGLGDGPPDGPIVPAGITHWVRVSITNYEDGINEPFQQQIVVDSSRYSSFEAENSQNVEFFDARGMVLPSWLESGNSSFSTQSVYWVQLRNGIPARSTVDVYIGFGAKDHVLFNGTTTGEAPRLGSRYGEYDNGAFVFPYYANFAGTSLPAGWYTEATPEGEGGVQVNNGARLSHHGPGGGAAILGSNWPVGDHIVEMQLRTQQTVNGQEMLFVCSSSPTQFMWTPNSVGYQNMSGLEIQANDGGTPAALAAAVPNPMQTSVIGFQGSTLFANYQPVARIDARICGGDYLASSVNTGRMASFSFDWIRMRARPPGGHMPVATFGVQVDRL